MQTSLRFQAANRLSFDSAVGVVARRARPFAQFLNAPIDSAIVFDNGTNSVRTRAIVRSVGSFIIECLVKGIDKHGLDFIGRKAIHNLAARWCRVDKLSPWIGDINLWHIKVPSHLTTATVIKS